MNKLVIERIVECVDGESFKKGISSTVIWHDILNYENTYILKNLIDDGWEIQDVKVSLSTNSHQGGYRFKYDHTILILVKQENEKNTL